MNELPSTGGFPRLPLPHWFLSLLRSRLLNASLAVITHPLGKLLVKNRIGSEDASSLLVLANGDSETPSRPPEVHQL